MIKNDEINKSIPINLSVNSKSDAKSLNKKGDALLELGLYNKSIESFNKAIAIDNNLAASWMGKGEAFSHLDRLNEADMSYKQALSIDPQNAEILRRQSVLLRAMGRGSKAETAMIKATELG